MRRDTRARGLLVMVSLGLSVLTAVAQVALAPWLYIGRAMPDFLAATTIAAALHFGPWAGVFWGLGVGLLADVLGAHPPGVLTVPLIVVGYAAGLAHRLVLESKVLVPIGVGAIGALVAALLQVPMAVLWGYPVVLPALVAARIGPQVVYTAAWTWLFFLVLLTVHRLQRRERLQF